MIRTLWILIYSEFLAMCRWSEYPHRFGDVIYQTHCALHLDYISGLVLGKSEELTKEANI